MEEHPDSRTLNRAIVKMTNGDVKNKIEGINEISALPDVSVIDLVVQQMLVNQYGPNQEVKKALVLAACSLAKKGVKLQELVTKVESDLSDQDSWVKTSAAYFIGDLAESGLYDDKSLISLKKMLHSKKGDLQSAACYAVGYLARQKVINEAIVPMIIPMLGVEETRWNASHAINQMAQQCVFDPACLPFLYALLDDKERGIRSNAISAIVYLADKNIERGISLRVFIAHFDSEDFEKKTVGLEGLAELVLSGITDPYYLEEAVDLLDNNSVEVRNRAAKLIGALAIRNVTDPRCWHSLVAMMDNEETARISTWAFNCLMGSETAQPQLIELMCESDLEIRILALRGLKKMVEKGVYNPVCLDLAIISLNEAHSKDMDNSAAWLIGELAKRDVKDRRCLPRLIQMMDERDTIESSSWALWQLAEKEVYAPSCLMKVISLLDDGKVRIRNNAAFLIGGLARNYVRNRKSLPLLIALMEYSETSLASTYALCCLAEKDVCDDTSLLKAIKLLDDSEAQVRGYAAALVGLLAKNGIWDSICLPTLIKLFDDSDEDTKADAIEAAARFYSIANEEQREVIKLKMTELKTIESEDIRKAIDMALEEIAKIESPKA